MKDIGNTYAGWAVTNYSPSYIEKHSNYKAVFKLEDEFLNHRKIPLADTIDSEAAMNFFHCMDYLCNQNHEPIRVYIMSNGGEIISGKMIYDIMESVKRKCVVETFCLGRAASMGAVLLAAGTKGHRFILPHSEVMIHEVLVQGGIGGSATSISRISQSINESRDEMNAILAKHTGRTIEEINEATSFDNFMNAEEAIKFGICDKIAENIF